MPDEQGGTKINVGFMAYQDYWTAELALSGVPRVGDKVVIATTVDETGHVATHGLDLRVDEVTWKAENGGVWLMCKPISQTAEEPQPVHEPVSEVQIRDAGFRTFFERAADAQATESHEVTDPSV